jgi:hypothetical protein
MKTPKKAELDQLLENAKSNEKRSRYRVTLVSLIPIAISLAVFTFFAWQVKEKEVELTKKNLAIAAKTDSLLLFQEELQILNDSMQLTRKRMAVIDTIFDTSYNWSIEEVKSEDPTILKQSLLANERILKILGEINPEEELPIQIDETKVRHYMKEVDENKVYIACRKSGFRDLIPIPSSYYSGVPINQVSYSKETVEIETVKYLLYFLIRQGVEIKKVGYYRGLLKERAHTLELSSDSSLVHLPMMKVEDVDGLELEWKSPIK